MKFEYRFWLIVLSGTTIAFLLQRFVFENSMARAVSVALGIAIGMAFLAKIHENYTESGA